MSWPSGRGGIYKCRSETFQPEMMDIINIALNDVGGVAANVSDVTC